MAYFKQERFDLFRTEHGFYRGLNDPGTLERAKETAFATHPFESTFSTDPQASIGPNKLRSARLLS
jgi:hypothetical protein